MVDFGQDKDVHEESLLEISQQEFFDRLSYPDPHEPDQTAVYRSEADADYSGELNNLSQAHYQFLEDPQVPTEDPGIDVLSEEVDQGYPDYVRDSGEFSSCFGWVGASTRDSRFDEDLDQLAEEMDSFSPGVFELVENGGVRSEPGSGHLEV